jgi:hypothetical protein
MATASRVGSRLQRSAWRCIRPSRPASAVPDECKRTVLGRDTIRVTRIREADETRFGAQTARECARSELVKVEEGNAVLPGAARGRKGVREQHPLDRRTARAPTGDDHPHLSCLVAEASIEAMDGAPGYHQN